SESVDVPVVLHAFVPPRPSGTWREISSGCEALPPLWPGSIAIVLPSRSTSRAAAASLAAVRVAASDEADCPDSAVVLSAALVADVAGEAEPCSHAASPGRASTAVSRRLGARRWCDMVPIVPAKRDARSQSGALSRTRLDTAGWE